MSDEKEKHRYYIIRHNTSGVWICKIEGAGTWYKEDLRISGRRIWSWDGRRLECSQIAHQGVMAGDKLGDWVDDAEIADEGRVELLPTTKELVEHAKSLPRWSPEE